MRTKILVLGILCLITTYLTAQQSIPVDLVTGAAQIAIPLTEVQYGDLSVPIGLSYNARGVRPQAANDFYGVNFQLMAAGEVRREVRGLPDDYTTADPDDLRRGWLINYATQINDFIFTSDDNLTVCSDEINDWTFLRDLFYNRDPEPDMFSFNAPGLSGRFVFGADKLPKLIPYQDVKIDFTPLPLTGSIATITITKNDGTTYVFSEKEITTRQSITEGTVSQFLVDYKHYLKPAKFGSAWYLTSMKSAGGAVITFCYGNTCRESNDYTDRNRINASKRTVELSSVSSTATSSPYKQYSIKDMVSSRELVSISSPVKKVYFNSFDTNLSSIKITAKGTTAVKKYTLKYAGAKNASEQTGKAFLEQIIEGNSNCESFPAYRFEYYDVTFNASGGITTLVFGNPNIKQDLWGYFNDVAVSKNPTIYYYNLKTGAERYRFYSIPGQTPTATITGADRSVNPTKVISGALKTISYPTGATTTITYEPNDYHDLEANATRYGPGLRVKQVVSKENGIAGSEDLVYDYEYKLPDGKSSGNWIYRSVFGYHDISSFYATLDDQSDESLILYKRVKVKRTGRGESIYDYYLPGTYPLTSAAPDWNATQTKFARGYATTCASYGEIRKQYYSHPFPINTNYDFERGLLYKVTDYSGTVKVKETTYGYQRLSSPVTVVKGLKYELLNGTTNLTTGNNANSNTYVFGRYSLLANLGKVTQTETVKIRDMADTSKAIVSSTTYTYSTIHNMLKSMQRVNSDNSTLKTTYTYAKDFSALTQPLASDLSAVALKKLNDNFRHGSPVEVISSVIRGATETYVGASVQVYGEFADSVGGTTRVLPKENRVFSGSTTSYVGAVVSPASGTNQTFVTSSYRPSSYVDAYDFIGNPITTRGVDRQINSVHFGYDKTVPLATFSNAAASEVVYDGFDSYTSFGFTTKSAGLAYTTGRTGQRGIQLQSGKLLERPNVVKGRGLFYRYSVWLKGTTACQVTFKTLNGTTVVSTGTISYGSADLNNWRYFEGRLPVSSLGSTFGLRVEATGTITLDDAVFYPESSSVAMTSFVPLVGKTSVTDTRGVSEYYEYDALGRLKYVKDQDNNLRQSNDYYYSSQPLPVLSASFIASFAPYQVVKDVTVNYSLPSGLNCSISPLTYTWYVNDVQLATGVTFSYTFSTIQKYVVRLTVTHPTYGTVSSTVAYDVKKIGTGNIASSVSTPSTAYAFCDVNHDKTFTLTLTGCYVLPDVDIRWYINVGSGWVEGGTGTTLSSDRLTFTVDPILAFNGTSNMAAYSIRCDVSTTCPVTGVTASHSTTVSITYNGSTQCM